MEELPGQDAAQCRAELTKEKHLKVPNIVHFVFVGETPDAGGFGLHHYLAVKSAAVVNRAERVLFHCAGIEPSGEWWRRIRELAEVRCVDMPAQIHGRPLSHPAHKADVLRLQILQEFGGIYLDLDTITVRPLTAFRRYPFVMGKQTDIFPWNWKQRLKKCVMERTLRYLHRPVVGFCNAVLLAEPGSQFIKIWLEEYKTFRSSGHDSHWDEHSVKLPQQLARRYPQWIHAASEWSFHYPLFDPRGLRELFEENHSFSRAYVHHLWERFSREKYLSKLTVEAVRSKSTTYNRIARRFI